MMMSVDTSVGCLAGETEEIEGLFVYLKSHITRMEK
jgi:hypothetical protein